MFGRIVGLVKRLIDRVAVEEDSLTDYIAVHIDRIEETVEEARAEKYRADRALVKWEKRLSWLKKTHRELLLNEDYLSTPEFAKSLKNAKRNNAVYADMEGENK